MLRGLQWRVGNGATISILHDNWIPGVQPGTFTPLEPLPDNAKVESLMTENVYAWDIETVRSFFAEDLAQVIQSIPISKHGGEDFAAWPHDRFGIYTVKSAYFLARTSKFFSSRSAKNQGDSSDRIATEKQWKSLWSIIAPGKMKIVLWRLAHDCLPTGFQLKYRQIAADDRCIFCG